MHSTTLPFTLQLPPDLPCVLDLHALATHFETLVDQRHRRGIRYPLAPLLALAVCAKLAGHSRITALAEWAQLRAADLARLFGLARTTMPHPSTWSRLFAQAVDVVALEHVLGTFFQRLHQPLEVPARGSVIVAVDGKTLRGTIPTGHTRGVHLVAAYLPDTGVVLAQLAVDGKENEIVVVPTVLAQFDLTGMVVVGDAMQTQRQLSTQIVEAGGDFLWFVKDNQPTLHTDIARLFTPVPALPGTAEKPTDFTTARQINNDHGRLEERRITVSSWLQDYSDWPYLAQVFKLERIVWRAGKATSEVRYGITSLPAAVADAERLLTIARAEWGIENGLHYRRDVSLAEDASRLRRGHGPQVMAALNNAVIGLVLSSGARNLAAVQRNVAFRFDRYLARLSLPH
jgi:predicted transposase YbfD/YdcC